MEEEPELTAPHRFEFQLTKLDNFGMDGNLIGNRLCHAREVERKMRIHKEKVRMALPHRTGSRGKGGE